ncbi:MAG: dephospho-CoA kinase [Candidatus Melainabacteria bacterium RIFCSPLOWO2_02_FULL_35_15]|nr:MAG: dephospho-CoA kinase [Candidatus Melainabacteria bacterium RIFCSPLOWO2_12_FULL_35_11]OGI14086.1 MAG: dephospho-CoA kinase [Candidatus Melainabacteria bacterium RIFCSPLOWO2_02_FULL_35_15]
MKNILASDSPYLIGITGGFGTGKSLAGKILEGAGITVIDTDEIVKNILETKNNITLTIQNEFGAGIIINKPGEYINRKALAKIIFNDDLKRKKLESILHPEVNKVLDYFILQNKDKSIIAVLVPLLFECHLESFYNEIWCVTCKSEIQLERLLKKGFTPDEIKLRINSQLPIKEKTKKSNFVIDNSDTIDETKKQVLSRLTELVQSNHNPRLSGDK